MNKRVWNNTSEAWSFVYGSKVAELVDDIKCSLWYAGWIEEGESAWYILRRNRGDYSWHYGVLNGKTNDVSDAMYDSLTTMIEENFVNYDNYDNPNWDLARIKKEAREYYRIINKQVEESSNARQCLSLRTYNMEPGELAVLHWYDEYKKIEMSSVPKDMVMRYRIEKDMALIAVYDEFKTFKEIEADIRAWLGIEEGDPDFPRRITGWTYEGGKVTPIYD